MRKREMRLNDQLASPSALLPVRASLSLLQQGCLDVQSTLLPVGEWLSAMMMADSRCYCDADYR